MENPFSLENKVIVITGASSGIGRQCAISCSRLGAKLLLIGRNHERLNETLSLIEDNNHLSVNLDVTEYERLEPLIELAVLKLGPIAGFIHCAGYEITLPLNLMKVAQYEDIFATNVFSALEISKVISKKKFKAENQSIIFISSIYSTVGNAALTAYSSTKAALIGASKSLSVELAPKQIRVNTISPGWIKGTQITEKSDSVDETSILEKYPLGFGSTEDVANACIYLLSDASKWVTGTNLIVDGGYTAK